MKFFEIPFPTNLPRFRLSTEIHGTIYNLRFLYNFSMTAWVMDILDAEDQAIQLGIPLQAGIPLTFQTKNHLRFPKGEFLIIDESGNERNPKFEEVSNIKLIYASPTE